MTEYFSKLMTDLKPQIQDLRNYQEGNIPKNLHLNLLKIQINFLKAMGMRERKFWKN